MSERYGYANYFKALAWMKKNRGRDVSTSIGGVMLAGIHKAVCYEYKQGSGFTDYIFRSSDNLLHRERVWSGGKGYKLGTAYTFELALGGDGSHRIEAANGEYKLINLSTGSADLSSTAIKDLYQFVKEHKHKLVYLKVKWRREHNDATEIK